MTRRRDPEEVIDELRAGKRELERTLVDAQRLTEDLRTEVAHESSMRASAEQLVAWLLKDQNVPDLAVTVTPGSRTDLEMMRRLVDIVDPQPLVAVAFATGGIIGRRHEATFWGAPELTPGVELEPQVDVQPIATTQV